MSGVYHRVVCDHPECSDSGRPRVWRESCPDCARDRAESHRSETGHRPELMIIEPSLESVTGMTRRMRRLGWQDGGGW